MSLNFVRKFSSRVPLIKFRKGAGPDHAASAAAPASSQATKGGKPNTIYATIIEDWQLPTRFKRRPISDEECQIINLGGAL